MYKRVIHPNYVSVCDVCVCGVWCVCVVGGWVVCAFIVTLHTYQLIVIGTISCVLKVKMYTLLRYVPYPNPSLYISYPTATTVFVGGGVANERTICIKFFAT